MKHPIPKAFKELLHTRARYKAFYGGRGSAKSHSFATCAIVRASEETPIRVLCCREIQKSIRESIKATLDSAIVQLDLQDIFVSTQNRITSCYGSEFFFEGLRTNPTAIQSFEGIDLCMVDESQSVSQKSLDILIPTIRTPGSEIWLAWNPRFAKDPVDKMFRGEGSQVLFEMENIPPPYEKWAICHEVSYDQNQFFPDVLKAEMERDKRRDPDKYLHVWKGYYLKHSNAAVFRNWRIDTIDVPTKARPYYGADWGFAIDPTVLVRVFVFPDQRVLYIDAEVGAVGIEIDRTPAFFDTIASGNDDPLHPRKWAIMADSARPETISYMQRYGYPLIERARKGPGSVEEGIEFIKSYDVVIHPNCKRCIDEFASYSYEIDDQTDEVLPSLADEDNHTIDAVRYAVENIRRNIAVRAYPILVTKEREYPMDNRQTANPALGEGQRRAISPPMQGKGLIR